jgi:hypothetical protein
VNVGQVGSRPARRCQPCKCSSTAVDAIELDLTPSFSPIGAALVAMIVQAELALELELELPADELGIILLWEVLT